MSKTAQIEKLLSIKSLRRKLAELEAANARAAVFHAEDSVQRAVYNETVVKETSEERRQNRISELLEKPDNVAVQNAMIANVFLKTDYEIAHSQQQTLTRRVELENSKQLAEEKQKKLARFLQMEERAKKFCERLKSEDSLKALRTE